MKKKFRENIYKTLQGCFSEARIGSGSEGIRHETTVFHYKL